MEYLRNNESLKSILGNRDVLILLILILVLASLLRFYGLGIQSFWFDELITWQVSNQKNLTELFKATRFNEGNPPLYGLVIYFIIKYIGDSESILRLPSAICSVISIFIIFLLGCKLYSYRDGLIASAITAVLARTIHYGQEARVYAMLLLFIMLATLLWIKLLWYLNENKKPSFYTFSGYIITAIISSYLHYFGLYLIILQGLGAMMLFIRTSRIRLYIILIYLPIFLAYLPWLPAMLDQIIRGELYTWIPKPKLFSFARGYLRFLFNYSNALALATVPLYSFLFIRILYNILRTKEYKNMRRMILSPDVLLILWLVVPFLGMYIKSISSTPILTDRNLIISLPPAYLLLARSITQLPVRQKSQTIITFAITIFLILHLIYSRDFYSKPHKQQFREAVDYIVEHDNLYEDSIITGNSNLAAYYFQKKGSNRRVEMEYYFQRKGFNRGLEAVSNLSSVSELISTRNPRYIWYICGHWNCPDEAYVNYLSKKFILRDSKKFIGTGVWLFERKKPHTS